MTPAAGLARGHRPQPPSDLPIAESDVARVLRLTTAFATADRLRTVADVAAAGLREVLGGRSASVNLFTGDTVEIVATDGLGQPEPGTREILAARTADWAELVREWDTEPRRPLVLGGATWSAFFRQENVVPLGTLLVLVPIPASGAPGVRGVIAVDRTGPAPRSEHLALATALAEQVRAAVARTTGADVDRRRLGHLDLLERLPAELATTDDVGELVERLAPFVRAAVGAELVDVQLRDGRAGRLFAAAQVHGRAAGALRQWQRDGIAGITYAGGLVCVPVRSGTEVLGVLRARPAAVPMTPADETVLATLGAQVGCAVLRGVLTAELATRDEQLATSAELDRVSQQLRVALGERLAVAVDGLAKAPDDPNLVPVRRAVISARTELRLSGHAMTYLSRPRRGGIAATLRTLVRDAAQPGYRPELRLVGTPRPLSPGREEALYRVIRETLAHSRVGRATTVVVRLAFADDEVTLHVTDDGTALAPRSEEVADLLATVRSLQRRIGEVGGSLDVSNLLPRGVRTLARVPVG